MILLVNGEPLRVERVKSNYTESNHMLQNVGFQGEGKTGEKPLAAD